MYFNSTENKGEHQPPEPRGSYAYVLELFTAPQDAYSLVLQIYLT